MNFTLIWHDVSNDLKTGKQPHVLLERPKVGEQAVSPEQSRDAGIYGPGVISRVGRVGDFWVPVSALNEGEIKWGRTVSGDFVRVPVFAYEVSVRSKSVIAACGFELGIRAAYALARRQPKAPLEVKLIVGRTVDDVPNGGYRYYFGLAIRVED